MSVKEIGHSVSYSEAMLLVSMLLRDHSSWLHAAVAGWTNPVSPEFVVLTEVWNLLAAVNSGKKKPKPYPTPWAEANTKRLGKTQVSRDEAIRRLNTMNPPQGD